MTMRAFFPSRAPKYQPINLPILYACSLVRSTFASPRKPSVPKYFPMLHFLPLLCIRAHCAAFSVWQRLSPYAKQHEEFIANLPFVENFKACNCCGEILLKSPNNFVRKTNSSDGFTNRCKRCDKLKRQGGKKK